MGTDTGHSGLLTQWFLYTASGSIWVALALEQNFSHSFSSSDRMKTDEARPANSSRSVGREAQMAAAACHVLQCLPPGSLPFSSTEQTYGG